MITATIAILFAVVMLFYLNQQRWNSTRTAFQIGNTLLIVFSVSYLFGVIPTNAGALTLLTLTTIVWAVISIAHVVSLLKAKK